MAPADTRAKGMMRRRLAAAVWLVVGLVVGLLWALPTLAQDAGAAPPEGPTPDRLTIAYCGDCAPFQFTGPDGAADGRIIDLWRLWADRAGVALRFLPVPRGQGVAALRDGRADAHAGLFFTPARRAVLDYGPMVARTDTHLFHHQDVALPQTARGLKAFRIGVLAGDAMESWLTGRAGAPSVVTFADDAALMAALPDGTIKVFAADALTGLHRLAQAGLVAQFRHRKQQALHVSDWYAAVAKGNGPLLRRITEGLAAIPPAERRRIARTWASGGRAADPDALVIGIDQDYPPLSMVDFDGTAQGLLVDIWREWGKVAGRSVRFKAGTWSQTLEDLRNGEVDIHSGLFRTPSRETWMDFSIPVQAVQTSLFTRPDATLIGSLEALDGRRVAAIEGSHQLQYLKTSHPEIDVVPVPESADYVVALLRGQIDAFVEEAPAAEATLARMGLGGLVSRRKDLFRNTLHAGVLKTNGPLLALVNQGLKALPRSRLAEIEARWIRRKADRFFTTGSGPVSLTDDERAWVAEHPVIRIAATADWPPFEWRDERTGAHKGISADFMALAAEKVGLRLDPQFNDWTTQLEKLRTKALDVAPGLNRTPDREEFLTFTEPFIEYFSVVFTTTDRDDLKEMADLDGKTVAVEKGYALAEVLARDFPKIKRMEVTSAIDALQAVSAKRADAYIGNQLVASYLMKKYLLGNLKAATFYNRIPGRYRFGVRDDWPMLRDILNKGLSAITDEERSRIIRTHTGLDLGMDKQVRLTDQDREWLSRHRKIRLGIDSNWPPFEYLDEDGTYSGLASGYMEVLSKRLDLDLTPQTDLSWSEAIKALEKGEKVDVLPAVAPTDARRAYMNFTRPYLTFPVVIVTRKDSPYVGSLSDLDGKRVGVIEGYFTHEILVANHKDIIPVTVKSLAEGLDLLAEGGMDGFIDNLGAITYELDRLKLDSIKVAAPTQYKVDLSIGVRKDWPELARILDKALDTIDEKERQAIQNTWLAVRVNIGLDLMTILTWAVPIGGSAVLVIVITVFWNRKLGREITERIRAEQRLQDAYGVISDSIDYAARIQRSTLPSRKFLDEDFGDHFILWKPRDVVGGDLYWYRRVDGGFLVAVGDCTGHGVPGAILTMIATGALDRALREHPGGEPGAVLQTMNRSVKISLGQHLDDGESDDGLELGLCRIDQARGELCFAGSRFSLFMAGDGAISEVKGTKAGLGYRRVPRDQVYDEQRIPLRPGLAFYMTSDGIIDQVGGERRRMFGKKRFRALLESIHDRPMAEQEAAILEAFEAYMGDESRRDDVCVIGFRV
ncbi:MAG: transporter substrate-binding domain-containing protein [Rhodobacterales bacterium]|nr:transporter substrate-binding domain-containing protein [Rhodobacterales bacterium]